MIVFDVLVRFYLELCRDFASFPHESRNPGIIPNRRYSPLRWRDHEIHRDHSNRAEVMKSAGGVPAIGATASGRRAEVLSAPGRENVRLLPRRARLVDFGEKHPVAVSARQAETARLRGPTPQSAVCHSADGGIHDLRGAGGRCE